MANNSTKSINSSSPFSALASIKSSLPIKETVFAPASGPYKEHVEVKVGMKVVRPVLMFNTGRKRVIDLTFKTDGNTTLVRISPEKGRFWTDERVAENGERGIVIFLNEYLPINWTHLEIIKINKGGKSAVGKVHAGTLADLYTLYNFPA